MANKNSEKLIKYVVGFLKEERQRQDITYYKLGPKSGVHATTISLIERGIQSPSLLICHKLSVALGLELSDIIKKAEEKL